MAGFKVKQKTVIIPFNTEIRMFYFPNLEIN